MTAAEAKDIADNHGVADQLEDIVEKVKEAAQKGEYKIWYYREMLPLTRENLKTAGYTLSATEYDQREGTYLTTIEWY